MCSCSNLMKAVLGLRAGGLAAAMSTLGFPLVRFLRRSKVVKSVEKLHPQQGPPLTHQPSSHPVAKRPGHSHLGHVSKKQTRKCWELP